MSDNQLNNVTIALTKGRPLPQALELLSKIGIEPVEDMAVSRKLVFETNRSGLSLMVLRSVGPDHIASLAKYFEA